MMDGVLRRLTPIVLLALAGLVWFEPMLPLQGLRSALGETFLLRFVLGVLCLYTMFLVIERQRMETRFVDVLGTFKRFYEQRAAEKLGAASGKGVEAIAILVGALESADAAVRASAQLNLKRLTGKDFGGDRAAWQRLLDELRREQSDGGGQFDG